MHRHHALSFIALAWVACSLLPASAHAMGRKLDLTKLPGKYDYVPTPDTSIACPETITVTYDAASATLDSEIFHFANIGKGEQDVPGGEFEPTPDHASYTDQSMETKLTSDSIEQKQYDHMATSDTSGLPMDPGPLDTTAPMGIIDSTSVMTTRVKFDEKTGVLKKTVDIDGNSLDQTCEYQKEAAN